MKKLVFAGAAGAVVAFMWSMVSWMVLPWHNASMKELGDDTALTEIIRNQASSDGFYFVPNMAMDAYDKPEVLAAWGEKAKAGPYAMIMVRPAGIEPGMGRSMSVGIVVYFLVALAAAFLLTLAGVSGLLHQALFVMGVVVTGVVATELAFWNWWYFPISAVLVNIADAVIGWFLAGLAIAKIGVR